jgi:transketolase
MIEVAGQGHVGGDFSVTDLLTVLYESVLNVDPEQPTRSDRDIFILSKGHASASLYATLANIGFFDKALLASNMKPMSALNGHPAKTKLPGVETSTGPLGHGLPVAVGAALGRRLQGAASRVFVITGDGEMQEGSNWEALMSAAHFGLANLMLIIDRNGLQQGARTEETNALDPLDSKLAAFGWDVRLVDGHDFAALEAAMKPSTSGRPVAVVALTVKGSGVSFIEDRPEWHHKVPDVDQFATAREELR